MIITDGKRTIDIIITDNRNGIDVTRDLMNTGSMTYNEDMDAYAVDYDVQECIDYANKEFVGDDVTVYIVEKSEK